MHSRLLSFLSDLERAIQADDPAPDGGRWQNSRAVNYRDGLARLQLAVARPDQPLQPRGTVQVQSFCLADGSACLKAQLGWAGTDATLIHSIFSKPGCNWKTEARRLAALWMAGAPAGATPVPLEQPAQAEAAAV
jgi:hypothetical protein